MKKVARLLGQFSHLCNLATRVLGLLCGGDMVAALLGTGLHVVRLDALQVKALQVFHCVAIVALSALSAGQSRLLR